MARRGQRQSGARRTAPRNQRRVRDLDNEGIIPVLARAVREVETGVAARPGDALGAHQVPGRRPAGPRGARPGQGRHRPAPRRSATSSSSGSTASPRSWPRPPPATPRCSRCSPRTPRSPTPRRALQARDARGRRRRAPPEEVAPPRARPRPPRTERRVVPQSVVARQLANPFLAPDFSAAAPRRPRPRRLARWELLGPLFRSFEDAAGGASSCMALPEPTVADARRAACELMPHQAQVVAAAAAGHRTFLLADEPGLGKTAQALLAAQAADAYPLLAVVPNVVKTNWAREAGLWTPQPPGHRDPRRRRRHRRLRRHRRRQLRGARPARRLARRPRLPRHGRRRGALHQEQDLAALAARAAALRADPDPRSRARC